jgi:hypothetical protein
MHDDVSPPPGRRQVFLALFAPFTRHSIEMLACKDLCAAGDQAR